MTVEELEACYDLVWAVREELKDKWPTPNPQDSLRFAQTESCGEATDVWLRQNPLYQRNHPRHTSLVEELTQTAYMLLTALGPDFDWTSPKVTKPWAVWETSYGIATRNGYNGTEIDWIAHLVSDALQESLWDKDEMRVDSEGWYFSEYCGLQALVCIAQHPQIAEGIEKGLEANLKFELDIVKAKFKGKRKKVKE